MPARELPHRILGLGCHAQFLGGEWRLVSMPQGPNARTQTSGRGHPHRCTGSLRRSKRRDVVRSDASKGIGERAGRRCRQVGERGQCREPLGGRDGEADGTGNGFDTQGHNTGKSDRQPHGEVGDALRLAEARMGSGDGRSHQEVPRSCQRHSTHVNGFGRPGIFRLPLSAAGADRGGRTRPKPQACPSRVPSGDP